jgi:hypothetical protein
MAACTDHPALSLSRITLLLALARESSAHATIGFVSPNAVTSLLLRRFLLFSLQVTHRQLDGE